MQAPENLDTSVARALLGHRPENEPSPSLSPIPKQLYPSSARNRRRITGGSAGNSRNSSDYQQRDRSMLINGSSRRNSWCFSGSYDASQTSSSRDATPYLELYNGLAKEHGLQELDAVREPNDEPFEPRKGPVHFDGPSTPIFSKSNSKHWLLNKLVRTPSLVNIKNTESRLLKKESIGNLFRHGRRQSHVCKSLDDVCRLGGVSTLNLPGNYAPVELIVPTCLAATANYLVLYGRDTPGIFRIPGQNSTVNSLYQHYMQRIRKSQDMGEVETTIGSLTLPHDVAFTVHDVASAFKKFIRDFPGGVLGSVKLFCTLRDIWLLPSANWSSTAAPQKSRLLALALLSLRSQQRMALISAVLGLLAFLKQDEDDSNGDRTAGPESMTSKALGVVFAPILLGDLTEHIELERQLDEREDEADKSTTKRSMFSHGKTPKQIRNKFRHKDMASSVEKAKLCANLTEYLIRSWEEIVKQFPMLEFSSRCQTLASRRVLSSEEEDVAPVIKINGLFNAARRTFDGCEDYSLPKAASNPFLAGKAELLKPLPNLPGNETNREGSMYRSASMSSVLPRRGSGGLRVQIQSPSGRRHLARSTNALHSSDPVHMLPLEPDESDLGFTYSTKRLAWWEKPLVPISDDSEEGTAPYSGDRYGGEGMYLVAHVHHESGDSEHEPFSTSGHTEAPAVGLDLQPGECHGESQSSIDPNDEALGTKDDTTRTSSISFTGTKADDTDINDDDSGEASASSLNCGSRDTTNQGTGSASTEKTEAFSKYLRGVKKDTLGPQTPMAGPSNFLSVPRCSPSMIPRPVSELGRARRRQDSPVGGLPRTTLAAGSQSSPCWNKVWRHREEQGSNESVEMETPAANWIGRRRTAQAPLTGSRTETLSGPESEVPSHRNEDDPPVARRIDFRSQPEQKVATRISQEGQEPVRPRAICSTERNHNVGTLYAEIRRLHGVLGAQREEIWQLRRQVEAMKRFQGSRTLSEKLRETEREMRLWKQRAQWAKAEMQGCRIETQRNEREADGHKSGEEA